LDPLDPAVRQTAQLAPPIAFVPFDTSQANPIAPSARVSLEELFPQLVRRIAWAGDRRRGTVELELGAGRYEGTTVRVHADGGRVRIDVSGKDASAAAELRARIDARLRQHGLDVST
jgi:hypothetical protein